jgi:hypothetical protein
MSGRQILKDNIDKKTKGRSLYRVIILSDQYRLSLPATNKNFHERVLRILVNSRFILAITKGHTDRFQFTVLQLLIIFQDGAVHVIRRCESPELYTSLLCSDGTSAFTFT